MCYLVSNIIWSINWFVAQLAAPLLLLRFACAESADGLSGLRTQG